MITTRHAGAVIQALLHDRPLAVRRVDEAVQINLKAVSNRIVVDARRQPAGTHQRFTIKTALRCYLSQFVWRIAREAAAAAADVNAKFVRAGNEATLERAHHGRGDA